MALKYLKKQFNNYQSEDMLFAFFLSFNYMVPFFMYTREQENIVLLIRTISILLCVGLLLKAYWPKSVIQYYPIYWYGTLLYCLPFSTTFLYLLSQGGTEWTINIALATMLLILLTDWISFIFMVLVGVSIAIFCKYFFISTPLALSYEDLYLLTYTTIFSITIGLIFARRRQQTFNTVLLQNRYYSDNQKNIRHELASTLNYRENLLKELKPDEVALFDDMTTAYLQQAIYRITDYMRLAVTDVKIATLEKEITDFYKTTLVENPGLAFKNFTTHPTIEADQQKIKQLLLNAIEYIQENNTAQKPILIALENAQLGHDVVHMPNHTRTLSALKITITTANNLPPTAPIYKIQPNTSSTWVAQSEQEHILIENARIIDAHYGFIDPTSPHTQLYVLPVKLREVRGKVMELIQQPVKEYPEEITHPLAVQLEKELLERLSKTDVNLAVIQHALALIKRYHGGVKRKSGEPFFTHPIAVALILLDYSQNQEAILGALLHDTVEDTSLSLTDIERLYGNTVMFLVAKATNLEDHRRRISLPDYENIVRITNYDDPRAPLIKLADRLHNMRTINYHASASKKRYIAQETLDRFVPLANQLGLHTMAQELETLSKAVITPSFNSN